MSGIVKAFGQGAGEGIGKAAEGVGKGARDLGTGLDTVLRGSRANIKIKSRKGNVLLVTKSFNRKDVDIDAEGDVMPIETDAGVTQQQIGQAIAGNKTQAIQN